VQVLHEGLMAMPNRFASALACIASLTATAAAAQSAPPPAAATTVAPVTVQAAPLTKSEALKKSQTFVKAYATPTAVLGQPARWRGPVCVIVLGLQPGQAAIVASRVEEVAKAVGLKLAPARCKANIEIAFSAQPQDLLDWVTKHSEWILGYHFNFQTKAVKTVTRPVQAWYMTATLAGGANNAELAFMNVDSGTSDPGTMGLAIANNSQMETLDTPNGQAPNGCGDSRFSTCRSSMFENVFMVVDSKRVQGQPLGPLADYLAMLALSQPRSLDGCLALASVLDLYAPMPCPGHAPPDGLTPADAAYLTALYSTDPEAKGALQGSDIAGRMAKMVASPIVRTAQEQGGH
jgi:hypothetical protein